MLFERAGNVYQEENLYLMLKPELEALSLEGVGLMKSSDNKYLQVSIGVHEPAKMAVLMEKLVQNSVVSNYTILIPVGSSGTPDA